MEQEINALDEVNKGVSMGKDATHFILDKTNDKKLKKELETQYKEYEKIAKQIEKLYAKYSDDNLYETNSVNKMLTWYGVEVKTLLDNSSSKIDELMLQGTNMGIIEGRNLLNNKDLDKKVHEIIEEFVDMQETVVEHLKHFL